MNYTISCLFYHRTNEILTVLMIQLKKQIKESFFNPIFYFLPVMIYLGVNEYFGVDAAWKFSFPAALVLLFYVYFEYRRIFLGFIFVSIGYLLVGIGSTLITRSNFDSILSLYGDELLFALVLSLVLFLKDKFDIFLTKRISRCVPMSNNLIELYRVIRILLFITISYLTLIFLTLYIPYINKSYTEVLKLLYIVSLLLLVFYEIFRVFRVRNSLLKEDWLPIVSRTGRVIGSSQYQAGVQMDKNLMYPVVRFYFIDNGMLLLHKRESNSTTDPELWDASESRHVRMSESINQALHNLSKKHYNVDAEKFFLLTRYEYKGKFNRQLIFLFLCCRTPELEIDATFKNATKWWIPNQIEDNLDSGIFSERFKKEYYMIKRSGLLNANECDCECVLKKHSKK